MKKDSLNCSRSIVLAVIVIIVSLFAVEGVFRLYLSVSGHEVPRLLKFDEVIERTWFKPHPYLVYTFKPSNKFKMSGHPYDDFTINKFGFRSTLDYDVKSESKPANTIRIATLGGSTVMGANGDEEVWPYLLGKYLDKRLPDKEIEVLNEGLMGYTSTDNLIDLSLRVIDFNPDIYIIYLGTNDYLAVAPSGVFKADHSHFRKTLWETMSFSAIELVPGVLLRSKALSQILLSLGAKDRRNLLDNTGTTYFRKEYELNKEEFYQATETATDTIIRNVESMIGIIRQHNPEARILLSSFYDLENPYWILRLNRAFATLSKGPGVEFVDAAAQMPREQNMTLDKVHFTREGAGFMAEIFTRAIVRGR